MLLVIDIGNTRIKWGVFADENLLKKGGCLHADLEKSDFLADAKTCQGAIVANVAGDTLKHQVVDLLKKISLKNTFATSTAQACSVLNGYEMPNSLGIDRWAAAIAAWHMTQQPTVLVNAGTAITIDAIENSTFLGGTIQPGLRLMQQSLSQNTAQLKIATGNHEDFPKNTADAIETGCINAVVGAVMLMVSRMQTHAGKPPMLILTGGDAQKLVTALNFNQISATIADDLVLHGLRLLEGEEV